MKEDGKSYGRLWLHTDITARKQAEERLRLSEEKLAKASATNLAAIVITRLAQVGLFGELRKIVWSAVDHTIS